MRFMSNFIAKVLNMCRVLTISVPFSPSRLTMWNRSEQTANTGSHHYLISFNLLICRFLRNNDNENKLKDLCLVNLVFPSS